MEGGENGSVGEDRISGSFLPHHRQRQREKGHTVRELRARTTPEEIDRLVEKAFQKDAALARKVKLYLYHSYTAQSLKEIGMQFGIKESFLRQAAGSTSIWTATRH